MTFKTEYLSALIFLREKCFSWAWSQAASYTFLPASWPTSTWFKETNPVQQVTVLSSSCKNVFICSWRCLKGGFIFSVVMVTEHIAVGGTGTCDRPEASNLVLQWLQSSRVAGWLAKKRKNWWKPLSPWKLGSQVEAFGSPSRVKTYKTDLIQAWLYYHTASVR